MPFYEFKCEKHEQKQTCVKLMSLPEADNPLLYPECEKCGNQMKRALSVPTILNANSGGRKTVS